VDLRNLEAGEGGSLSVYLEGAPCELDDDGPWVVLAQAADLRAGTTLTLAAGAAASYPVMERLRLRLRAEDAAVSLDLRAQVLLKEEVASLGGEWLPPIRLSFGVAGSLVMPADKWLDAVPWSVACVLCEFQATSGSADNLTASLETAVGPDDEDGAWSLLASSNLASGTALLVGRGAAAPLGALRLKYTAGAALAGTLRAVILLKSV
jgi:hypothetical protein